MIDAILYRRLRPVLDSLAKPLVRLGIGANTVTTVGFVIGLGALPALAWQRYDLALLCILLNRLSDGLDGAIARHTRPTDAVATSIVSWILSFTVRYLLDFYWLIPAPLVSQLAC